MFVQLVPPFVDLNNPDVLTAGAAVVLEAR
jgi:hypothetical protein